MGSGPFKSVRKALAGCLLPAILGSAIAALFVFAVSAPTHAAAGINQQMNFQGRLLNAQGATVPDGYYNIQFKIYQDGDGQTVGNTTGSPAGTLKWTENWLNANGQGVVVRNGFLSVQLGSITPFGSSVDWNQDTLWLSMNIGGTNPSCTPFASCSPDGEMVPMKRMSATAYSLNALNANMLGGLSSAGFIQNTSTPQTANLSITGNGSFGGDINVTGVVTAGSLIEKSVTFTPTATGWYRVAAGSDGSDGGIIRIVQLNSAYDGKITDVEFQYNINGNGNGGSIQQTRHTNVGNGVIDQVRISSDGGNNTYLDIRVSTASSPQPVTVYAYGANMPSLVSSPVVGATAGSTDVQSMSLSNGLRTTSSIFAVGSIRSNSGFNINGTAGATTACSGGQFLQNATTVGGIVTGGSCVAASNGVTTVGSIDSQTKSANGAVISGTTIYLQTADASNPGLVSTGSQTFAGLKTFNSGLDITSGQALKINNVDTLTAGTLTFSAASTNTITSAASQSLQADGKAGVTIQTNGTTRAIFDTANGLYLGNGVTAAAPNSFAIRGTGSSTTGVAGGSLTLQGGAATVGNANGGNVNIMGGVGFGTGVSGLVVLGTPTFSTASNDANCYTGGSLVASSCTITSASVDGSGAVIAGFNTTGQTASLPDPTIATAGRIVYVTAANGSNDFTLSVNGGGQGNLIAMRQNTTATMIWNGSDWTAAGASSSTTLQSAYDNTLQSAGGAELIVSKTSTTNGLTIRDSASAPVNGTLLSVQTQSAATLLSINGNVTEYATNSGAETAGGSASTFPANTWSTAASATVSRYTTAGDYIATGQASVSVATTAAANDGVKNRLSTSLTANTNYNVSFSARLQSGTFTDMNVYYSIDGTANSVTCATDKTAATSVWTKINCTFAAPAAGITANNAIIIRQATATARTFYVENLSVTIAADYNYATDGSVNDAGNFSTNWSFVNATSGAGSVSRSTSDGYDASDSAGVTLTTGAANAGLRNRLAINPLQNTLYRVSVYAKLASGSFNDFKVRYAPTGNTAASGTYIDCVDYNTQAITTSGWTQVTCYIKTDGTTVTTPYVNFVETTASARTFYVDAFSMTLSSSTTPNVQIGSGVNGGPTTLFTLDKGASAPIASNNDALLGSMYYDTTLGKLQCYEADGWGACGSSPDNVVTISPEYTNAVMHGTGVGTMTSDICSDTLDINDGSSGQPTICGSNETYNFYKWTSPQASTQSYAIYVTYQLPGTFKSFQSGLTSLMGRTDSSSSTVNYQIYRSDAGGLTQCGSTVAVSTGSQSAWQTGAASGAADPSTCGFAAGNSIVFKINVTSSSNANAYVGNLNFTFSNR